MHASVLAGFGIGASSVEVEGIGGGILIQANLSDDSDQEFVDSVIQHSGDLDEFTLIKRSRGFTI